MILLDTSVLSLAFRRRKGAQESSPEVDALRRMILRDDPLAVPGIVLQEVLSGLRTADNFERLRTLMAGFPILLAEHRHHVSAARLANVCRQEGVAATTVDCLIAALAIDVDARLFTTDRDFTRIARHCPLRLFSAGGA